MATLAHQLGNKLFGCCYPVYRPLYCLFKAITDQPERKLLREHLRPGMTVVDAGANIGVYSVFMAALVGPTGKIHSFEPSPENFARLRASASGCGNVICNNLALGSVSREMSLYLSPSLNVDHRMYATADEARQAVPIQCVALDDYFAPGTAVDFIKMDIQGYELSALQGAERTLRENPGLKLLVEFWPYGSKGAGVEPNALPDFFKERGFHVAKIARDGRLTQLAQTDFKIDEAIYCNLFVTRS